jgi:hypothetical protein
MRANTYFRINFAQCTFCTVFKMYNIIFYPYSVAQPFRGSQPALATPAIRAQDRILSGLTFCRYSSPIWNYLCLE